MFECERSGKYGQSVFDIQEKMVDLLRHFDFKQMPRGKREIQTLKRIKA